MINIFLRESDIGNKVEAYSLKGGHCSLATGVNTTIPLMPSSTRDYTINRLKNLKTTSGTITASIQINGVDVTGLSGLSVTSTPQSPTASGANLISVDDRVTLVLSSNSSAVGFEFTMELE